jgi:hypothetical protein
MCIRDSFGKNSLGVTIRVGCCVLVDAMDGNIFRPGPGNFGDLVHEEVVRIVGKPTPIQGTQNISGGTGIEHDSFC